MEIINIAAALNSKYMRYTYVMLTSLFMNQTNACIHVYLLHNDLTKEDKEKLSSLAKEYHHEIFFLHIDKSKFPKELPTTDMWSLETYFRLMLLDVLPAEIDRLLYIDVDMIVNKPIGELYHTDFEGALFCVCRDMSVEFPFPDIRDEIFHKHMEEGFTYFNAGLMLWNVKALREEGYSFEAYMNLAKELKYKVLAPDQDLLNYMHWNRLKFVDEYQYDLFSRMAYRNGIHYEDVKEETTIIHFAGMKSWEGEYVHYDIEQLWWDYAKKTPFYQELLEEFVRGSLMKPVVYDNMLRLSAENKQLKEDLNKSVALCKQMLQNLT